MNNPSTCPHFALCSGCQLPSDLFHPPIWDEAVAFFKKWEIPSQLICDGFEGTRYKAKLAVRPGPEIGLFKKGTHEVVSIPHCLVHHPAINRAVSLLKQEIVRHNFSLYQEKPSQGTLRYLQFFVERYTGKIQLVLVVNETQTNREMEAFCQSLLKYDLWHSIWLNFQPQQTNRILGEGWKLVSGSPYLWQTLNQTPVAFHPGAFSQAHLPLFEKMVEKIGTWVRQTDTVLELYAGVGAIGLTLQNKVKQIVLVENNPLAYLSFQQTQVDIPYHCIDAKKAQIQEFDVILVDPPRKGLEPELLRKICEKQNGRLIYVSCGFESFQADCHSLIHAGWKLDEAFGYLLFPGTNQVETLALFNRS